jgi:hypothetical protein
MLGRSKLVRGMPRSQRQGREAALTVDLTTSTPEGAARCDAALTDFLRLASSQGTPVHGEEVRRVFTELLDGSLSQEEAAVRLGWLLHLGAIAGDLWANEHVKTFAADDVILDRRDAFDAIETVLRRKLGLDPEPDAG